MSFRPSSPAPRRQLLAVTHDGTFHADDVLAWVILQAALKTQCLAVELVRTRDKSIIAQANIAFDVGGEYAPERGRYDHHMADKPLRPGRVSTRHEDVVGIDGNGALKLTTMEVSDREAARPYSSAGLIWRDYGPDALRHWLNLPAHASDDVFDGVWQAVDKRLVQVIDDIDNGVGEPPGTGHIVQVIDNHNLAWDVPTERRASEEDKAFRRAEEVMRSTILAEIAAARSRLSAENVVASAWERSQQMHPASGLLELPQGMPFEGAIHARDIPAKLVLYPADRLWYLRTVPTEPGGFQGRMDLPEAWAGLRDKDLAAVSGIADAEFCHPNRFIAGAHSREGALALAAQALALDHTAQTDWTQPAVATFPV